RPGRRAARRGRRSLPAHMDVRGGARGPEYPRERDRLQRDRLDIRAAAGTTRRLSARAPVAQVATAVLPSGRDRGSRFESRGVVDSPAQALDELLGEVVALDLTG